MNKLIPSAYFLLLLLGLCQTQIGLADGPLSGEVVLDGEITASGTGPDKDYGDHYNGRLKVTVTYKIVVSEKDGKKQFDYSKSFVKMQDSRDGWSTLQIPITKVEGDPCNGTVKGFSVKGKWYTGAAEAGIVDEGLDGTITLDPKNPKKGQGTIISAYSFTNEAGKTVLSYTFTAPAKKPASEPKNGKQASSKPASGQSALYQADTGLLRFDYGRITDLPDPNDPLLNASLQLPDFQFRGFSADGRGAIFWPLDNLPLIIENRAKILQVQQLPVLYYSIDRNTFFGALHAESLEDAAEVRCPTIPELSLVNSTFLSGVTKDLSEDPNRVFWIRIEPEDDFMVLTEGFTGSAITNASMSEFVADSTIRVSDWLQPQIRLIPSTPSRLTRDRVEPEGTHSIKPIEFESPGSPNLILN